MVESKGIETNIMYLLNLKSFRKKKIMLSVKKER